MGKYRDYLNSLSIENTGEPLIKRIVQMAPVAIIGDWDGFKDNKSVHISKRGFDKGLYEIVGETKYKNRTVYICREKRLSNIFFFGVFGKETEKDVFVAFAQLQILKRPDLAQIGYHNAIQMSKVEVHNQRLAGIGKTFYRWFIMSGYTIISDMFQYDGARKLYDSLSRDKDTICDIIDSAERKILKHNIRADSGKEDWDFDTDLWSHNFDKSHIRIALYKK